MDGPRTIEGWDEALTAYAASATARGDSRRSVAGRSSVLRRFGAWCEAQALIRPTTVARPHLVAYQVALAAHRSRTGAPLHPATRRNHLTALRVFFRWLKRSGRSLVDPAADLELPRVVRPLPRGILTAQDLVALRVAIRLARRNRLRDRAILETLYATGVRREECVRLTLGDLDTQHQSLTVRRGKGGRQRVVPIAPVALGWIAAYRRRLARLGGEPSSAMCPLFEGRRNRPLSAKHLSDRFRALLDAAGIDKPGACHLFRHAMATHMLDNGADIRFIQAMLGHADISTTIIYTHVSIRGLAEVYRRTHPSARI